MYCKYRGVKEKKEKNSLCDFLAEFYCIANQDGEKEV